MKKSVGILLGLTILLLSSTMFTGCAGACQRMDANGGIIGTYSGAWIVVKQSGGQITDVYKLDDVMVQSESGSDGWLFLDKNQNPVHIGGDMKAIRCNNEKTAVFDQYVEFHADIDLCTYKEKYEKVKGVKPVNIKDTSEFKPVSSLKGQHIEPGSIHQLAYINPR